MKKSFLAPLITFLLIFFMAAPAWSLEQGTVPPDFQLSDLDGKEFRLSEHKGEVMILKLATTWCPTCRQQSADFHEIGDFLKENNIRLVEVFVQDSEKMVREYIENEDYPMAFDAILDDGRVLKDYSVYLIPRVLLIGPDFTISRDGNMLPADELKKELEKLVAKVSAVPEAAVEAVPESAAEVK